VGEAGDHDLTQGVTTQLISPGCASTGGDNGVGLTVVSV
jgi:hypothetical protein